MAVNYGWEKFYVAIRSALVNKGTVQDRLKAVISGVSLLSPEDLPDAETRKEFDELIHETTKHPADGDEGTIEATVSRMSDEEATKWLHKAVDIFSEVARAYGRRV